MTYIDSTDGSEVIRLFSKEVDPIELVWHRDGEDRIIKSTESSDWKIQLDNRLPLGLNEEVLIKKGEWHRLIKGSSDLQLKIVKLNA